MLGQVLGQLGMFGFIINTIQASSLEYELMKNGKWNVVTGKSHPQSHGRRPFN